VAAAAYDAAVIVRAKGGMMLTLDANQEQLWATRAFIYARFASTARPPSVTQTATELGLSPELVAALYRQLHDRHAILLEDGTTDIRMANPFSAVPTPFCVQVGTRNYWANCAWDALGIPAALHTSATVTASCAASGVPLPLRVTDAQVEGAGLVHFALPLRHWYDNLIHT
jgi:hypothetical protein